MIEIRLRHPFVAGTLLGALVMWAFFMMRSA